MRSRLIALRPRSIVPSSARVRQVRDRSFASLELRQDLLADLVARACPAASPGRLLEVEDDVMDAGRSQGFQEPEQDIAPAPETQSGSVPGAWSGSSVRSMYRDWANGLNTFGPTAERQAARPARPGVACTTAV